MMKKNATFRFTVTYVYTSFYGDLWYTGYAVFDFE